jgi:hypothetical protein
MADVWHLLVGSVFALAGGLSLIFGWPLWIPILVVVGINTYQVLLLVEVAIRSEGRRKIIGLPSRTWSLLLVVFMLATLVFAFGEIYLKIGGVFHVVEDVAPGRDTEGRAGSTQREVLASKLDACYFSLATITTLGYGDYVPATQLARLIVMWELGAGVLLVAVGFPLVVSRLATFAEKG